MFNIVFIVKYYYPLKRPSGILRFVMNLSEKLGEKTNLTIVTCKFNKKHSNQERFKNYNIIRAKFPFYITSAIKTARLKPDVIIFGTGISQLYLLFPILFLFKLTRYLFNKKKPVFFLYQLVELDYKCSFVAKYICNKVDKIICTNISLYNFYSKYNKKNKAVCLPPGVNLAKFDGIKNIKTSNKLRIGFFGHLNYRKGSDILIKSFLKLDNENLELFLAGPAKPKNKYYRLAIRHKNIIIKDYLDNIEEYIASCDLLVFPYRSSDKILGLSLSAIEGLALGKPLIVSANNCLKDLVENNLNGYIFKNEKELVNYLNILTRDEKKMKKFGSESIKKSQGFDINRICDKLFVLIKEDLEEKNESLKLII